jgi:hypothetical protein
MRKNLMNVDVIKAISKEQYHTFPDTHMVVCCMTLKNGYHVIGESYCVHPDLWDERVSQRVARGDALNKVWTLGEYAMKDRIYREKDAYVTPR